LKFGPAEFFSLMVLGLVASVVLAQGSLVHAIGMVVLGLLLGLIGTDVNSGTQRFSFGIYELADGIGFVTVAMGMFGLGEIIRNLENEEERSVMITKITGQGRLETNGRADPSRDHHRLGIGHSSRQRFDPGLLCCLLYRKEGLKESCRVW
jgi:TctA family transporter